MYSLHDFAARMYIRVYIAPMLHMQPLNVLMNSRGTPYLVWLPIPRRPDQGAPLVQEPDSQKLKAIGSLVSKRQVRDYAIPYYSMRYHIMLYHTMPYHTIPYHTIPYHTIPYHRTRGFCGSSTILADQADCGNRRLYLGWRFRLPAGSASLPGHNHAGAPELWPAPKGLLGCC